MALGALLSAGHDVALVVTRADKRRGRAGTPAPTAVKQLATEKGIPVSHDPAAAAGVGADLGVVVAYGRIIKPDVLRALTMVNVHFSLLPRWRGAAPVERAILAGDAVTGVCLMDVEEGLDTGAVYRRVEVRVGPEETAPELTARLAAAGAGLLTAALDEGLGTAVPQSGEATYASKLEPGELHLEWSRPAEELHRVVRIGRSWTTWRGVRLLVLEARVDPAPAALAPGTLDGDEVHTGSGRLRLVTVQPEGRRRMPALEWANGARPQPGERLGA